MPFVFNFDGLGSTGNTQFAYFEFAVLADIHMFIVVSALATGNSWNAGDCYDVAAEASVDDVGFTAGMIEQVSSEYCVDPDRIYASGMLNGGYMSYRLVCEMADRFAAIGPVAARNRTVSCAPSHPVPMIAMNGTLDIIVEYPQAASDAEAWAVANQCSPSPRSCTNRVM